MQRTKEKLRRAGKQEAGANDKGISAIGKNTKNMKYSVS